jgi:hypothetical protein
VHLASCNLVKWPIFTPLTPHYLPAIAVVSCTACFIGGLNAGEYLDSLFLAQVKLSRMTAIWPISEIGYKASA